MLHYKPTTFAMSRVCGSYSF